MPEERSNEVLCAYIDDLLIRLTTRLGWPCTYEERQNWLKTLDEPKTLRDARLVPILQAKLSTRLKAEVAQRGFECLGHLVENLRHSEGALYMLHSLATAKQGSRLVILKHLAEVILLCDSELSFHSIHPFLQSDNIEIRNASAAVLGRLGHPLSITALLEYLQSATKEQDIHAALVALEACGDSTLLPYTIDYAFSSHGKAYWPAITCISSWLRADATPFLISVLDRQRYAKYIAVVELAKWGDERAIPHIEKRVRAQIKAAKKDLDRLQPEHHLNISEDVADGLKYLRRFRQLTCFDELNREVLELLPMLHKYYANKLEGCLDR